jgi:hypothetical protein
MSSRLSHQLYIHLGGLTRLLLLVELSAWTSCLSSFTDMGVKVGIAGEGGSSGRSSFTMTADAMTMSMSMEGRGSSKTTSLDKGQDVVVKQDFVIS